MLTTCHKPVAIAAKQRALFSALQIGMRTCLLDASALQIVDSLQ
jgi:hypothetical protein